MSRRRKLITVAALTAIILAGAAWGGAWLTGTPAGARWLLETAARRAGARLAIDTVEGRLWGRLLLKGVRFDLPGRKATLERLELRWKPSLLLAGTIGVQTLDLGGIRIEDATPAKKQPPSLAWPRVPDVAELFDVEITHLGLHDLVYRRLQEQPLVLASLDCSLRWRDKTLSLNGLTASAPFGRLSGSIAAGLGRPSLTTALEVIPAHPVAGMGRLSLRTTLTPGRAAEQLAGTFTVSGHPAGAGGRVVALSGETGMTARGFNLRRLQLTGFGRRGIISGEGEVLLASPEPQVRLDITATNLDLAPRLGMPTDLSGHVTLNGSLERYRGQFALASRGKRWRTARVSGTYRGNRTGVSVAPFRGELLGGSLKGNLDVGWDQAVTVAGVLRGRGLDPARIAPQWRGVVNLDLDGGLAWSKSSPLQWHVNATLPESRLHGQPLTGAVRTAAVGSAIRIDRLVLLGNGFDIHAAGTLAGGVDCAARVTDLSRLLPGAAGSLEADGRLFWRNNRLGGHVNGHGSDLAVDGVRAADALLTATLPERPGSPLHVAATLRQAAYGTFRLDSAALEVAGTLRSHTLNATLAAGVDEVRLALAGAYGNGTWQGEVTRLSYGDNRQKWHLAAPAPLTVRPDRLLLSSLVMVDQARGRLELATDLSGRPPAGEVRASWSAVDLAAANRWLQGEQVGGTSDGSLRVTLAAGRISAVTGLVDASGTVTAEGQSIAVKHSRLRISGTGLGTAADMEVRLAAGGGLKGTFSSRAPFTVALPTQGDLRMEWTGIDLMLFRSLFPAAARLEGLLTGKLTARLLPGGEVDLQGRTALSGGKFQWRTPKEELNAVISTADLSGAWRGSVRKGRTLEKLVVRGTAVGSVTYAAGGRSMALQRCSLTLAADAGGMRIATAMDLPGGGTIKASLVSDRPARLALPDQGSVALEVQRADAALLQPWLPVNLGLEGILAGQARGTLLPGQRFALDGSLSLAKGKVRGKGTQGEMNVNLSSASVTWGWRGEELSGSVDMVLDTYGRARGHFQLPLPARFAAAFNPRGPVRADLSAQVQEHGVLNSLFPGVVQESHGDLAADLQVTGTWGEPALAGTINLAKAGAYLPTAGIQVREVQLTARLAKDQISIDSFSALSGAGAIRGTAQLQLHGWEVAGYRGTIIGDRFQTVYFPELQVACTPNLTFEGTPQKLTVRGEVRLPELSILGSQSHDVVAPSSDVIVEGRVAPVKKAFPLALDVQIQLVLGDKVLVKTAGIDARLGGSMELMLRDLNRINSKGEIRVIKGRYQTYGVNLEIVRGRLFYAGGPLNQPTLDILALRTVGDVRAGVIVGGTLRAPVTKLYSEPAMPDVDILAYIVLGHPLGSGPEQADLLSQAAGVLLSSSQSSELQDQIKSRLGLSGLEIGSSSSGTATSKMGYQPIAVAPPGSASAAQTTGVSQTMVTVGKYLTPSLYLRYGRSLFSNGNQFLLRYDIFKQLQLETQTGAESGVDLYYKIEFN